jgi:hypothetical protein
MLRTLAMPLFASQSVVSRSVVFHFELEVHIMISGIEVKRLVTVATLAVLLVASILTGLGDKDVSVADTSVPNNDITSSVSKAGNSSASVTIKITMYTGDDV